MIGGRTLHAHRGRRAPSHHHPPTHHSPTHHLRPSESALPITSSLAHPAMPAMPPPAHFSFFCALPAEWHPFLCSLNASSIPCYWPSLCIPFLSHQWLPPTAHGHRRRPAARSHSSFTNAPDPFSTASYCLFARQEYSVGPPRGVCVTFAKAVLQSARWRWSSACPLGKAGGRFGSGHTPDRQLERIHTCTHALDSVRHLC